MFMSHIMMTRMVVHCDSYSYKILMMFVVMMAMLDLAMTDLMMGVRMMMWIW